MFFAMQVLQIPAGGRGFPLVLLTRTHFIRILNYLIWVSSVCSFTVALSLMKFFTSFHSDHWYNGTSSVLCSRSYSVCLFSLLRLLSSSLRLLLSSPPAPFLLSSSPLIRLLSSAPPAPFILSSCLPVLISSSSPVLLLFSPPLLRLLSSFHPGPLLFSGSCPPLFLFLLIPFSHRCSIQPSLSIYSNFVSHL